MLKSISISNYAIIDSLEIDFSTMLNVITGETGAGKSIIVGALGLILGDRADSTALVKKDRKCVVEGHFNAQGRKAVTAFLTANELDAEEEIVIRREIGINGKSRAFINDTPVNLSQLQQLSSLLVDLHQQFDTREIGESDFQRQVLDAMGGQLEAVSQYQALYREWHVANREWEALKEQKLQFDKEAGYNQFQFDELEEASFKEDELERIDADLKMLGNAEGIKGALDRVYSELQESEEPMVQRLKVLIQQLNGYASYHAAIPVLVQRLQSAHIELQDIAGEVESVSRQVNYDPQQIEQLQERLSLGYKLQKKHGVSSTAELIAIRTELESKLQAVLSIEDQILQKEKEAGQWKDKAGKSAIRLSEVRNKQIKPLEDKVNKLLAQVGMPNARLRVEMSTVPLNSTGQDAIEFLFNANIPAGKHSEAKEGHGHFQPVGKVASGGELSRLMLCIKSLVAQSIDLPTLIFDEIDTGISGEAARQVGIIMKQLAARRQVISITHQPQIAGKADAHYFVYKEIVKDAVKTNIRKLTTEERITAIARMLSGEKPTAAAMENAREMISN